MLHAERKNIYCRFVIRSRLLHCREMHSRVFRYRSSSLTSGVERIKGFVRFSQATYRMTFASILSLWARIMPFLHFS